MKLAVFDFDSTLMDGETIDELAKGYGVYDRVQSITNNAMNGNIDFYHSLKTRVSLLKGMKLESAIQICHNLPLIDGAKETIRELQNMGYKVVCFSGGFSIATSYFRDILGLDADFSNTLHGDNGILSGEVGGEMMFGDSKGKMLTNLKRLLQPSHTIAVGDGANDVSMFAFADTKIAFCAKKILQERADIIINDKNLLAILSHIKE